MSHVEKSKDSCSMMHALWSDIYSKNTAFINALMTHSLPKNTKLRHYFYTAFFPFYEAKLPSDCLTLCDALALWAAYLRDYPYRSLIREEREVYENVYAILSNQSPEILNRWLTPKQLQEEYGFSQSWQNKARMASSGSTLPFHKIGKFIKYDRREIDQWIEIHKVR
jgi:predicted DNA-binding transcriptional regulator AlpA